MTFISREDKGRLNPLTCGILDSGYPYPFFVQVLSYLRYRYRNGTEESSYPQGCNQRGRIISERNFLSAGMK